ncbi:MAG: CRISPR system precrRNA processing endoribonuclease RAMP protein Cas6 [Clostridia bacterium]|nr:CRISPR system precrRNA processing endoribonuclease RAMP protein Cas6 [Clostridia bacterium]
MLTKIKYKLDFDQDKKLKMSYGQFLHGFIMENVDPEYGDKLHQSGLKPFSQYLHKTQDTWIWEINILNDEAYEKIAGKIFKDECKELLLRTPNIKIRADKIEKDHTIDYNQLTKKIYLSETQKRYIKIYFRTPCSFKAGGEYQIIPSVLLMYTNLINRFNEYADTITLKDESVVNHLIEHTKIRDYKLRSFKFPMGKGYVKSFIGELVLNISGPETLASLANLIFEFANYSGIGIKTALGMGGVAVE